MFKLRHPRETDVNVDVRKAVTLANLLVDGSTTL
jgi:hypothetical protein